EDGTHNRAGYVNYRQLLRNNNTEKYAVDWSKINTDINNLLGMVKLTPVLQVMKNDTAVTDVEKPVQIEDKKRNTNPWFYYLLAGVAVFAGIFIVFRKGA